ncbi:DinB family protein [Tepidiforma sp.]|uniref:DinB family protein n=1 Tax=Tepidiforma sp. TaxID=2682230 RepID=UPI002ADE6235|nr:DinB family protein [Tepidiforma sp.]
MATRAQVDELLAKMAEERAQLIRVAESLSPEDALRVPVDATGEEQWTALEQLAHLCEMERTYDAWVRAALREENPDLSKVPWQTVPIPVEDANRYRVADLLHQLELERRYTLGLIDGMRLEDFDRVATSPMFGTLTVLQWLRSFYRHDRQHTAQIQGRQSDYRPQFLGQEPNQRRMRLELVARRQAGGS